METQNNEKVKVLTMTKLAIYEVEKDRGSSLSNLQSEQAEQERFKYVTPLLTSERTKYYNANVRVCVKS
jgi:hypothetical protein